MTKRHNFDSDDFEFASENGGVVEWDPPLRQLLARAPTSATETTIKVSFLPMFCWTRRICLLTDSTRWPDINKIQIIEDAAPRFIHYSFFSSYAVSVLYPYITTTFWCWSFLVAYCKVYFLFFIAFTISISCSYLDCCSYMDY